jgi:hypothetical protein
MVQNKHNEVEKVGFGNTINQNGDEVGKPKVTEEVLYG